MRRRGRFRSLCRHLMNWAIVVYCGVRGYASSFCRAIFRGFDFFERQEFEEYEPSDRLCKCNTELFRKCISLSAWWKRLSLLASSFGRSKRIHKESECMYVECQSEKGCGGYVHYYGRESRRHVCWLQVSLIDNELQRREYIRYWMMQRRCVEYVYVGGRGRRRRRLGDLGV